MLEGVAWTGMSGAVSVACEVTTGALAMCKSGTC